MRPEPGMNMSIWGEEPKICIYIYDDDETFIKVEVLHLFRCYTHTLPQEGGQFKTSKPRPNKPN